MNVETLLQVLEAGTAATVKAAGGEFHIAADPDHILQLLTATQPGGFRVVVAYAGERSADADEAPGIRDVSLNVIVQAAPGFQVSPGRHVFRPTPSGRDSLLHLSDDLDRIFRGFSGTTYGDVDERGFRFLSRDWLAIEEAPTRQLLSTYALRIGSDKPAGGDILTLDFPGP